jgi:hypothetical protein
MKLMVQTSNEPSFDRPIPGQSLTAELGARPWQNPPQYTTVDEVVDYYMERMSSEDFMVQLVDVLEMGVPVTTLANTIQMSSVMNGVHTLDTGMLALPLIMEMLMLLGDSAGIKYNNGLDNPNEIKTSNPTRDTLLTKVAMQYKDKLDEADFENTTDDTVEKENDEPTGLMARRN